ncbi:hypothetical protein MESS2_1000044 [Mesorhizobium metallidurans STM 2683]|uniref:Uncharacterized protein n=1 Tax=Mesorhizobium metallidurans STM 2683 TaxID=1297569 RepID=M5EFH0_9HYPH|nr:hypothetical protein MESS2_1000044 [Mesorhizobium metallidurans STM 2683]
MTLPCIGLGKYDGWTTIMRFRLKTFQRNPQKGNSSSSGPYEPGRSYRPVIIAGHSACPSTTGAEAIFLLAASRWVLFQAELAGKAHRASGTAFGDDVSWRRSERDLLCSALSRLLLGGACSE